LVPVTFPHPFFVNLSSLHCNFICTLTLKIWYVLGHLRYWWPVNCIIVSQLNIALLLHASARHTLYEVYNVALYIIRCFLLVTCVLLIPVLVLISVLYFFVHILGMCSFPILGNSVFIVSGKLSICISLGCIGFLRK